ncbi:MAG: ATP-dependent protease ATPase subunit HslU [Clostridia bacterium]|nr:ATP-dependent protease ATPase subunit HslU [Clostridia bacterium]
MNLSPKQIVAELDKYIVGQEKAKRAVAVALRNRFRRSRLDEHLRDEITPKNIIMKGPTGVGKTEIARRLAKLVKAPFVKVEATKFTEVGYVGRDVESMIRDLVEASIRLVKNEKVAVIKQKAEDEAALKVARALAKEHVMKNPELVEAVEVQSIKPKILTHEFDNEYVSVEIEESQMGAGNLGAIGIDLNLGQMFESIMPKRKRQKRMTVADAFKLIVAEESEKLIDMESVTSEALRRAEQDGIIFLDEIDKIAGGKGASHGPDVSRDGVQRDILPIVEGSVVSTKYGPVKTDFILFIAAGAFHVSKVEDLLPELQGRFPVLVELESLKYDDFVSILSKTDNSLILQYKSLLGVDKIKLEFKADAIEEIARIAVIENQTGEDIGARRLHAVVEELLEDISFNATGDHPEIVVEIDKKYVDEHLSEAIKANDLRKYVL